MNINHIGIYTNNIERLKQFYETYFNAIAGAKYTNVKKQFSSYFLTFASGGCKLEIMTTLGLEDKKSASKAIGLAHFALSTGSESNVIELTERLRTNGYKVFSEPRTTGDGYFESVVLDPDGNQIEITV